MEEIFTYGVLCVSNIYIFFLLSQENGQASRRSNDIPTRLAPRRTPILCRQTQRKVLLKKGKKKEGELGQNPQNKQETKRKKTEEKKKHETTIYGTLERGNPLRSKKKSV